MQSEEIRQKFSDFFRGKGHAIVPSSSLVPDDPSVLLTTAGMQQFKKYYTGELNAMSDFGSQRTASIQKSFRTSDIEEVGDKTHATFFEMLGNFSFGPVGLDLPSDLGRGGYFKRSAIHWAYEFIAEILGIASGRMTVTIFEGNNVIPRDDFSYKVWHEEIGIPNDRISECGMDDNFWGPTGTGGPCGPTTEIYVDGVEIWNLVFNEFYFKGLREDLLAGRGMLEKLPSPGIDTGSGFERLMTVLQGAESFYETDLFLPLYSRVEEMASHADLKTKRIVTDHLRASIFLLADGVRPSNKEAGYILRRLLRRILAYQIKEDIHADLFPEAVQIIGEKYGATYPEVKQEDIILSALEDEKQKFAGAVRRGMREIERYKEEGKEIRGAEAFYLYESFGLPYELIAELVPGLTKNLAKEDFDKEFIKHQEISRAGLEKKFGGHGLILDTGELKAGNEEELKIVTRLHTATHMLQAALRIVLGDEVKQAGSDITIERTRFDFSFPRKVTREELKQIEDIVNQRIEGNLPVNKIVLPREEAHKTGALYFFKGKYPDPVNVYFIGENMEGAFSKEFCGGPHVVRTGEIGKVKITKEEAVSAGVRRIRAIIEQI